MNLGTQIFHRLHRSHRSDLDMYHGQSHLNGMPFNSYFFSGVSPDYLVRLKKRSRSRKKPLGEVEWNNRIPGFFLGPPRKQQSKIRLRTHYKIGKWCVFNPYFLWLEIWTRGSCLKIWDRPRKWVLTRTTLFFWIPSLPEVLIQLGDSECFCKVDFINLLVWYTLRGCFFFPFLSVQSTDIPDLLYQFDYIAFQGRSPILWLFLLWPFHLSQLATDAEEQDPWPAFGPLTKKRARWGDGIPESSYIISSQNISIITGVSLTSEFLPSPKNHYGSPPERSFQI